MFSLKLVTTNSLKKSEKNANNFFSPFFEFLLTIFSVHFTNFCLPTL